MIENENFRQMALSFPHTEMHPHFDRMAFKVSKRRIFASLHEPTHSANIMLSPEQQVDFSTYDAKAIFPLPNKWGAKGVTTFNLHLVSEDILYAALEMAYQNVVRQ